MGAIAFTLREEFAGTVDVDGETVPVYGGGILAFEDGEFDKAAALDAGDGRIVIDDATPRAANLVALLDGEPEFERLDVDPDTVPTFTVYDLLNVPALRDTLRARGITPGNKTRGELLEAIVEADRNPAPPAAPVPADPFNEPSLPPVPNADDSDPAHLGDDTPEA